MKELKTIRRIFLAAGFVVVAFWAVLIALGCLPDILEADGTIEAGRLFPVTSPVAGILGAIHVKEGDRVMQGEIMAELDQEDFSRALSAAKLEVGKWRLKLKEIESQIAAFDRLREIQGVLSAARNRMALLRKEKSENEYNRIRKIDEIPRARGNLISEMDFDRYESEFRMAAGQMDLDAAQGEWEGAYLSDQAARKRAERSQATVEWEGALLRLRTAEADLEACQLKAPVTGTVMRIELRPGDFLQRGTRLTVVVSDDDLRFTALVRDEDMSRMKTGLPAEVFMDSFPRRKFGAFLGRVEAVAPAASQESTDSRFRVTIALEDLGKEIHAGEDARKVFLKPGQRGRAEIIIQEDRLIWQYLFEHMAVRNE